MKQWCPCNIRVTVLWMVFYWGKSQQHLMLLQSRLCLREEINRYEIISYWPIGSLENGITISGRSLCAWTAVFTKGQISAAIIFFHRRRRRFGFFPFKNKHLNLETAFDDWWHIWHQEGVKDFFPTPPYQIIHQILLWLKKEIDLVQCSDNST